jgi:argininosuccinate lyase
MNKDKKSSTKLFEGRFSADPSEIFSTFVDSIGFDIILLPYDIRVSKAHANMLYEIDLIDEKTKSEILDGLDQILAEYESGEFKANLKSSDEDIHSAIERRLTELKGDAGRSIHTGRSRNDLPQMSARLFCIDAIDNITAELEDTIKVLCDLAKENIELMMPGKTHLQHAQPILVAHWLLSHAYRLKNDIERSKS